MHRRRITFVAVGAALAALGPAGSGAAAEDGVQFLDPLINERLELTQRPDQEITPAVERFHATGENLYSDDEPAIAEGQRLYTRWCASCHLPDGSGRIGPNLNDGTWKYERGATPVGQFEIIYAGGAGAMQAFGDRLDQDQILKLIAFVDTLQRK